MTASKENCQHTLATLLTQQPFMNERAFATIKNFLEAASKRLPTEAALKNDKERKRVKP